MSIRSTTENLEYSSYAEKSENLSSNFTDIAPCKIEDIDRALFELFNEQLPLIYNQKNDVKRVPIIFATGERFALIARKKPLRDRSNALILPVISIMRTNVQMGNEYGGSFSPDVPQTIKKQISPEDQIYQRLINKQNFQNSDDLASQSALIDQAGQTGSQPGRVATRRPGSDLTPQSTLAGRVLDSSVKNNIFEIYEIPPPVYVTIDYEITLWTQYMQEMNNLLAVMASESHFHASPSFRIETKKGYKFVAYMDKAVSNQSNFDDFSEDERHVRSSFTMKVTGYILGNTYIGEKNKLRRYVSAPQISFETIVSADPPQEGSSVSVPDASPDRFFLSNLLTEDDPTPGQSIGSRQFLEENNDSALVGGTSNGSGEKFVRTLTDPFNSGKVEKNILVTKTKTTRVGETVYREVL